MKLKVDNGAFAVKHGRTGVKFRPRGAHKVHGKNPAAVAVYGVPTNAARLFVGFSVGKRPTWDVDHLASLIQEYRSKQKNDAGDQIPPDSSLVAQKGFYTSEDKSLVYESGAQVIVLSLFGESEERFVKNMIEVAASVARDMKQEVVILEVQRKGVPLEVYGVSWQS